MIASGEVCVITGTFCKVADGEIPYDFEALGEIVRERHEAIGCEPSEWE